MESPKAEPLAQSGEMKEDTAPSTSKTSGGGGDGPRPKKTTLKRTAGKPVNTKTKKRKKARALRPASVNYTVQQGEDMLLVISSSTSHYDGSAWTPPKKGTKKRKLTKGKRKATQVKKKTPACTKPKLEKTPVDKEKEDASVFVAQNSTDHRWGENVPEEVLIKVFQMIVIHDGAVPFLCR